MAGVTGFLRRRRRVVIVAALLAVTLGACRPSGERRLVSLREGELAEGELAGEVVYVETLGVRLNGLYVEDVATSERRRLNAQDGYVNSPSWSPDGTRVAYSYTDEEGFSHLYTIDAQDEDAEPQQLTTGEVVDDSPRWSPDGTRIVFASIRDGGFDWRLFILDLTDGSFTGVGSTDGHSVFPDWSHDGRFIVYSNRAGDDYKLRILDLETGEDRQVTDGAGEDLYARFSPRDRRILFSTDRDDGVWQLYLHDLTADLTERLIGSDTMDQFGAWSPDAEHIVFSAGHLAIHPYDGSAFPDGKLRWRVTRNLAWSPDWRAEP
ncbi:MAG: hypothetical protein ACRDUY_09325 [Nitriliruptorales bacterium]